MPDSFESVSHYLNKAYLGCQTVENSRLERKRSESPCCRSEWATRMRTRASRFSSHATSAKFPRALCLATAGMAFLLGAVVGVLLPFYVFVPALDASSNASTSAKVIPSYEYVVTSQSEWTLPSPSAIQSSPDLVPHVEKVRKVTSRRKSKLPPVTLSSRYRDDSDSHSHSHASRPVDSSLSVNEIGQVTNNKAQYSASNRLLARFQGAADRHRIDDHPSRPISATVRVLSSSPPSVVQQVYSEERRLPTAPEPSHGTSTAEVASPWQPATKEDDSPTTPAARIPSSSSPAEGNDAAAEEGFRGGRLVDGIFWATEMDEMVPAGFSPEDDRAWREFVNNSLVLKIEEGCGRMQNRIVTFDGGNESCCRYRQNNDQIQGEIFSFYLSRILGIGNLPPAVLGIVRGKEWQWGNVWSQLHLAQWNSEKPVVLTKFMPHLKPALIPPAFQNSNRRLHPIPEDLSGRNRSELVELVQWSDLIVFDYLTANLDRVVNNMFNQQWNAAMMKSPAHNLAVSADTGLLVFLDNESGLLHGYRLLDKYDHFHKALLDSLCIFRRRTADAVARLYRNNNVGQLLREHFRHSDPGMEEWLPFIPDRHLKTLSERIADVYRRIRTCQAQYGPLISS